MSDTTDSELPFGFEAEEGTISSGPDIDISEEMSQSFMEYAMSVIISRALPDVRDGLKPVQRRIVHSMNQANMRSGTRHRKSATVVGDVMARFHPHGDSAIYGSLVLLGQDFSLLHPLIDPQGNFGTNEDPPAQMRYTECRLSKIADRMVEGIDEDTVDFVPNYDGEHIEPVVFPARYPNLAVNGSQGIAVGMATNIAPHNLGEVVDACLYLLSNPDAPSEDLKQFIKGPDFPTGAYIVGTDGFNSALTTGRGSIKMRAVCDIAEVRKNRTAIVVTELPFQVSQDSVLEKIANLVNNKKIEGIADLRNESSARVGTRLVIELKSNSVPQVILNQLYKATNLQTTFGVNNVALVDGVPRLLNMSTMLGHYLDHQMEVIERRTRYRLRKAEERAHLLEGLIIAVDNIDAVVQLIRSSADVAEARAGLIKEFELSEIQANAILDMPLRRLTALEIEKLRAELEDLRKQIAELKKILESPQRRRTIIRKELEGAKEEFAVPRRSKIIPDEGELNLEDLIADEELIVSVSRSGYLKSVTADTYKTQRRGGRGVLAQKLNPDDITEHLVHTTALAFLLFFTNRGRVHRVRAHEIPRQNRTSRGTLAQAVLGLEPDERIEAIIDTRDYETSKYLVMVTRRGWVKRSRFKDYESRQRILVAIRLQEDDEVVSVVTTNGKSDILLATEKGIGIRFFEDDMRPIGRGTRGVRGIRLRPEDQVIGGTAVGSAKEVLLLTSRGYGKRTQVRNFRKQKRGGKGIIAIKLGPSRGRLMGICAVTDDLEVFLISANGIVIRTKVDQISRQSRIATGVKVIDLKDKAELAAFAVDENGETDEDESTETPGTEKPSKPASKNKPKPDK